MPSKRVGLTIAVIVLVASVAVPILLSRSKLSPDAVWRESLDDPAARGGVFDQVHSMLSVGMTEREALDILGPPEHVALFAKNKAGFADELIGQLSKEIEIDAESCDHVNLYTVDLYQSRWYESVPPQWFMIVVSPSEHVSYVLSKEEVKAIYGKE